MRLLVLCNQGNNRSVTLAHQLKYLGHDVLTAGIETNSDETLDYLRSWAHKTIVTDKDQHKLIPTAELWNMGPDIYPRPFNKTLLRIAQGLVKQKRHELDKSDRLSNGRLEPNPDGLKRCKRCERLVRAEWIDPECHVCAPERTTGLHFLGWDQNRANLSAPKPLEGRKAA